MSTISKEVTVAEKLKLMYELQSIDCKIDEIQALKGELPVEVQDLEDEISGLETRVENLVKQEKELEQTIAKYRADIKAAQALILKYEKQQENVRNGREFDALAKEVELQQLDIQLLEKRIREGLNNVAAKQATRDSTQQRLDKKRGEVALKRKELEQVVSETDQEEEKLRKKTEKLRKKVEPRYLKAYDKIRHAYRNGMAVVMVERDACGGCYNKIPAQVQMEIAQRKKINVCEHCGRVLVDNNILNID